MTRTTHRTTRRSASRRSSPTPARVAPSARAGLPRLEDAPARRPQTACFVEQRGTGKAAHDVFRVGLFDRLTTYPVPGDFPTPREAIDYARAIDEGRVRLFEAEEGRTCEVCGRPLPVSARADCRACSAACRMAGARARRGDASRNPASDSLLRSAVTDSARPAASLETQLAFLDPAESVIPPRALSGADEAPPLRLPLA